ncbi:hypothetical protein CXG81DRAFT_3078, partial [Caulochytrium protostelioides]
YAEYDMGKLADSRGGFLFDDPDDAADSSPEAQQRAQKKARLAAERATLDDKYKPLEERDLDLDALDQIPRCRDCQSIDIDQQYHRFFDVLVCRGCRTAKPEIYGLLTKTECKADYLLTESELQDRTRMPVWEKPNPHKSTWSSMFLFMRSHVEAFAWEKWGSPVALDAEFARRQAETQRRKQKKTAQRLKELRQRTQTSAWQVTRDEHTH